MELNLVPRTVTLSHLPSTVKGRDVSCVTSKYASPEIDTILRSSANVFGYVIEAYRFSHTFVLSGNVIVMVPLSAVSSIISTLGWRKMKMLPSKIPINTAAAALQRKIRIRLNLLCRSLSSDILSFIEFQTRSY